MQCSYLHGRPASPKTSPKSLKRAIGLWAVTKIGYLGMPFTILSKFYSLGFVVGPLLHALSPRDFRVSPLPFGLVWVLNCVGLGRGWA